MISISGKRRSAGNRVWTLVMLIALALCVLPLADILWVIALRGVPAIKLDLFVTSTSGVAGGLANAITGTLLIVCAAVALAAPIGILGALFVSELADRRTAALIRYAADTLTGVPSIVLGYVCYVALVVTLGWGFSLLAAAIVLMLMMLPYILRTADLAMQRIPVELRQASYALGATRSETAFGVVLGASLPGIVTGVLVAISISVGETAPLIYTAGWSNYMPTGKLFHSPVGYLTYVIWTFINEPFDSAHQLAYAAALILIVLVLIINVLGRLTMRRRD